jgi:DNA-binding FadR family transcriptional regulator
MVGTTRVASTAGARPLSWGGPRVDHVERWLRQQIADGHWPMNSQIPTETELIDALGVGRSTVREAVRSLAHVGMLETARGRGTFVRALSPVDRVLTDYLQEHEPRDIVEVRRALEVEAAGLAALRRTDDDIAALRASIDSAERADAAIERGKVPGQFHFLVVRSARNPLLADMYTGLIGALRANVNSGRIHRPVVGQHQINADHRRIVAAIIRQDVEAARAECADHTAREFLVDPDPALAVPPPA